MCIPRKNSLCFLIFLTLTFQINDIAQLITLLKFNGFQVVLITKCGNLIRLVDRRVSQKLHQLNSDNFSKNMKPFRE